jgi:hypothetical protein
MLSLPAQLYPPGLMARGLALCGGELPRFDRETRQITFAGVGARTAEAVPRAHGIERVGDVINRHN